MRSLACSLVAVVCLACAPAPAGPELAEGAQPLLSPLPLPAAAGNGALVKITCPTPGATGGNCSGAQITNAAGAAVVLNSVLPLSAPFVSPQQFSFVTSSPVDWSDGTSGANFFGAGLNIDNTFGTAVHRVPMTFSGYVAIPAAGARSFAVGSDDGYVLAISDGSAAQTSAFNANRGFAFGASAAPQQLTINFPSAGLYPFYLLFWDNGGGHGVQLAWANGTAATMPTPGSASGYSLVPASSLYAPDVRASTWVDDLGPGSATVGGSDPLQWTVEVTNRGQAPLGPHTLTFPVPTGVLQIVAPFPFASCALSSAGGIDSLSCPIATSLAAGATERYAVRATLKGLAGGAQVDVQPVVSGLGTAPEVVQAVATIAGLGSTAAFTDVFALADDAQNGAAFVNLDTGNAPVSIAGAALGKGDDDATRVTVGMAVTPSPTVTAPPSPSPSTSAVTIGGSSTLAPGTSLSVQLNGPAGAPAACSPGPAVASDGSWTCAALALPDGSYSIVARSVNAAGGLGKPSPAYALVISQPAPPSVTSPAAGAISRQSAVTFNGTSTEAPNAQVQVSAAGSSTQTCNATIQANGSWSCQMTLADGGYTVTARVLEASGALGPASSAVNFTVTTAGLQAPLINQTATPGNVSTPQFSGTVAASETTAGFHLVVFEGGSVLCQTALSATSWSCTSKVLADGSHAAYAVALDGSNNPSPASNLDAFVVDTVKPGKPTIDPIPSPTSNNAPLLTGSATKAGGTVFVYSDAGHTMLVCSGAVGAQNRWSCQSPALPDGSVTLYAFQTDPAGNTGPDQTATFTIKTAAPPAPVLAALKTPDNNPTPVIKGTETESPTTVKVYDGTGRLLCSVANAPVSPAQWQCTSLKLADGDNSITATATDAAGNVSTPSAAVHVVIDTLPPAAPTLAQTPTPSANATPTFSGTAEAGAAVTVLEGASLLCSTTALADTTWSCVSSALTAGQPGAVAHKANAVARDAAGNASLKSSDDNFIVDTRPAAKPTLKQVQTPPGQPGWSNLLNVALGGTGQKADALRVVTTDGLATLCGGVIVQDSGAWSCTSSALVSGVTYSVYAIQTTPAGADGPASDPITFTVDTHTPAAPAVVQPASPTSNSQPTVSGTAEPFSLVALVDQNNNRYCGATAAADGSFACAPAAPLSDGDYNLTATATTRAGLTGPTSSPARLLQVRTLVAPTLAALTTPTRFASPIFQGTGQNGTTVTVLSGETPLCSGAVLGGAWSCQPAGNLADGSYVLVAQAADARRHLSPPSAPRSLEVDTDPPAAPVLVQPRSPSNNAAPLLSGSAEAGASIKVIDATSAALLCTATADGAGFFQCLPPPFADGSYQITASATDGAGNVSALATPVQAVIVTLPPAAPAIAQTATPTNNPQPLLAGSAPAGTTVVVSEGARQLCAAGAAADGSWSCTPGGPLADGPHTLTATAVDLAGNTSAPSAGDAFVVDTVAPPAPQLAPLQALSRDAQPTFTGRAEPGSIVRVLLGTTADAPLLCSATAAADGTFACTSKRPLPDGTPQVAAFATDAAGNAGPLSLESPFAIDTDAPPVPQIASPADGADLIAAAVISGSSEPGSSVTILLDGSAIGSAIADANGSWLFTPSESISTGAHTLAAVATDGAGNVSSASAGVRFSITGTGSLRGGGCQSGGLPAAPLLMLLVLALLRPRRRRGSPEGSVELALAAGLAQRRARLVQPRGGRPDVEARGLAAAEARLEEVLQLAHQPVERRRLAAQARQVARRLELGPEVARAELAVLVGERALEVDHRREDLVDLPHPFVGAALDGVGLHVAEREVERLALEALGPLGAEQGRRVPAGRELGPQLESAGLEPAEDVDFVLGCHEERQLRGQGLALSRFGQRRVHRGGLEQPRHLALGQVEGVLQGLQDAELARVGDAVGQHHRGRQPEGQFARRLVGQPLRQRGEQVHQVVRLGDTLGRVGDGLAQIARVDTVELGPLEDAPVDLLHLDLGDLPVGHGGEHHRLEQCGLPGGVAEVDVLLAGHGRLLKPAVGGECRKSEGLMSMTFARAGAALLVLATALSARAQAPDLALDHLRPSSGGDGLLGLEGARPLTSDGPLFEAKLTFDSAIHPLVYLPDSGGQRVLVKSRFGSWLTAAAHVFGPLSLAAQLPATLAQSGDLSSLPATARGPSTLLGGLGDLRLTPRLSLLRQSSAVIDLSVQASLDLPTARRQTLSGDGKVQGELLVAVARRLELPSGQLELLGNAYGRLRPAQQFLDVKTGDEVGLRAGAAIWPESAARIFPRRVFGELEAQSWVRGGLGSSSPAEWRAGATFCATSALALEAGGGGALGHGIGSPAARFVVSLGWAPSTCQAEERAESTQYRPPHAAAPVLAAPPPAAEPPPPTVAAALPPEPPPTLEPAKVAEVTAPPELPPPLPLPALPPLPEVPSTPLLAQADPPRPPEQPTPLVNLAADRLELAESVRFQTGNAKLDARSFALLDQIATVLQQHAELALVEVQGHTDNQGAPARNRQLSQARAESVVRYLASRGVDPRRLRAKGYGSDRPLKPNLNKRNRDLNRRVELRVLERKPATPSNPG